MIYRTSKCPSCGKIVEQSAGYYNDLDQHIGNPIGQCAHCGVRYGTGKKFWPDMSPAERAKIYILIFMGTLFGGFMVSIIIWMAFAGACSLLANSGVFEWKDPPSGKNDPLLVVLCIPSLVAGYVYVIRRQMIGFASFKRLGHEHSRRV